MWDDKRVWNLGKFYGKGWWIVDRIFISRKRRYGVGIIDKDIYVSKDEILSMDYIFYF